MLGIAAGELLARAVGFEFRPHLRNRVYFAEPDRLLGWRNRPGLAGPYGGDEFLTWVTINADGQRGPHYPIARTPGTLRIAVLGDSQAWGDGVADDETFTALLDGAPDDGIEVLNFASPGYGTDQQLLVLDNLAARWRPDVVVVAAFVGNDLKDNLSDGTWQYPKPRFVEDERGGLVLRGVPVEPSAALHAGIEVYRAAMRSSALLNAIAVITANAPAEGDDDGAAAEPVVHHSVYLRTPSAGDRAALRMTERLLLEIAQHARAIGARPIVLLIPELWQVEIASRPAWRAALRGQAASWRRPQQEIRRALEADGVEVVDALPALARASIAARSSGDHTYYEGWRHLTALGHRTVARTLRGPLGVSALRPPKRSSDRHPAPPPARATSGL